MSTDSLKRIAATALNLEYAIAPGSNASMQVGGAGDDTLLGGANVDLMFGFDGNDNITGGAGDDVIFGGLGQDTIRGGDGNDVIDGGYYIDNTRPDTVYGEAGDDTFYSPNGSVDGGDGFDTIILNAGYFNRIFEGNHFVFAVDNGYYASFSSIEQIIGSDGGDEFWRVDASIIHGGGGGDLFMGDRNGTIDYLYGDDGNDTFQIESDAFGRANYFFGGSGDDYFFVLASSANIDGGDGLDTIEFTIDVVSNASRIDLRDGFIVHLDGGRVTWSNIEAFIITNVGDPPGEVIGTDRDDIVVVYLRDYDVYGGAGNDELLGRDDIQGGLNAQRLHGEAGDDVLDGGNGNDILDGGIGLDSLYGGANDDQLFGGAGDDFLVGGTGADALDGGEGRDTASYYTAVAGVNITLTAVSEDTFVSIENLEGSDYNDSLQGDANDNVLVGGAGNDTLDGAGGIDIAWFYARLGGVTVDLSLGGAQTVSTELGSDTLVNIEDLHGTSFADTLRGNGSANELNGDRGDDRLFGLSGNDVLVGDGGSDTLNGGDGDDLIDGGDGTDAASYVGASSSVFVNLGLAGSQNTLGAGNDTLLNVESLIGSAFDDTLTGNAGDNILEGGAGNDELNGGGGRDIASYAGAAAAVTINFNSGSVQATGGAGTDTLNGISGVIGSAFADTLIGSAADEYFQGGIGNDMMDGGGGIDTVSFENGLLDRGVIVNLSAGTAGAFSSTEADTVLNFENIVGSIYTDELRGNDADNYINGNGAGPAIVTGGDSLYGGGGNDILLIPRDWGRARGEGGNDILYGSDDGYSLLDGGVGDDIMYGGLGETEFWVDSEQDQIFESASGFGFDLVRVFGLVEYWLPANFERLILTPGSLVGHGNAANNWLQADYQVEANTFWGYGGDDTIDGGGGDDVLVGGAGSDILNGQFGNDTASYEDSQSGIQILLATGYCTGGTAEGDRLMAIENLRGSAYGDVLGGNSGSNVLYGGGADDMLLGLDGDDNLYGEIGSDTLIGGAGGDSLDGGAGIDTASYAGSSSAVTVNLGAGTGAGGDAAGDTLSAIENLIGSALNDTLTGNADANVLTGGAGADALDGGDGSDTASYADATSGLVANLANAAANTGEAAGDTFTSIENLIGSAYADTLRGDAGANALSGNAGNDTLVGGLGVDAISGGAGNDRFDWVWGDGADAIDGGADTDTLYVTGDAAANILNVAYNGAALTTLAGISAANLELINANMAAGTDWLIYSASAAVTVNLSTGTASGFASVANIENVVGGAGNDALTGNGLANRLDGGAGDDTLSGASGADTLIGGDGNDTLSGGLDNDSLQGGAGDDAFSWAAGDGRDTFNGGAGVDTATFSASAGADLVRANWNGSAITGLLDNALLDVETIQLNGGAGVDWLIYNASAAVTVDLSAGTASGFASISGIERVIGGSGGDMLTGDGADNRLDGQGGADTLNGGAGFDTVLGGDGDDVIYASAGNDSLQGQNGADTFIWTSTDGRDTFNGGAGADTLNMTGSASADVARANWNGSVITGLLDNALIDIEAINLDLGAGGAGGDWLQYNATAGVSVNLAAGTATGFASIAGVENIIGGAGGDTFVGDGGVNKINGAAGDDVITGGAGNDSLTGGLGADTFVYAAGAGADTINDFDAWASGGQDFIDVSGLGINAANFAARVTIIDTGADTVVRIDSDIFITLKNVSGDGDNVITQADFILGA